MNNVICFSDKIQLQHELTKVFLCAFSATYQHAGTSSQDAVGGLIRRNNECAWTVMPTHENVLTIQDGQPVKNGDVIRLQHVATKTYLHSHGGFRSPMTNQQEVTAHRTLSEGDANDNWRVRLDADGPVEWTHNLVVRLFHQQTGMALHSHPGDITLSSGRIVQEVTAHKIRDSNDCWIACATLAESGLAEATIRADRTEVKEIESNAICSIDCEKWDDFKSSLVDKLFRNAMFRRGLYLFRGQARDRWTLTSRLDRWIQDNGQPKDRAKVAAKLLDEFIKQTEGLELPEKVRNDRIKMLAIGQHHGLPTRLLDWTESPYIAAFFAFASASLELRDATHIAIWALNTEIPIWSGDYGVEIVDVPSYGNVRLRNQTGKFTHIRAPNDSLEDFVKLVSDQQSMNEPMLYKFRVPIDQRREALADLDAMGIDHARLFPDLEGFAKAVWMRTSLE